MVRKSNKIKQFDCEELYVIGDYKFNDFTHINAFKKKLQIGVK